MSINLDEVLTEWEKDCDIDRSDLFESSRDVPKLHSKYLRIYSKVKLMHHKALNDQKNLLKSKWLYYNGKMDRLEISKRGWKDDPFDGLKVMKNEMEYYYNSDPDIQASEDLVQYYKTVLDTLKDIIDNLKWRHQTIKNMIEWRKFEAGG